MAARVAAVMKSSTGVGENVPHEYGNCLWVSDGTTIRKRSSHMPTTTPHEAMTQPRMVRVFELVRIAIGSTKLPTTIVQYSGAYSPRCVAQNTAISLGSLPYQTVRRSLNTKYAHRMLISKRSLPRFSK